MSVLLPAEFEISTDRSRIDIALVHRLLSSSYWAQDRSRDVVERSIRHSMCFGVYRQAQQVAFGRVITDSAVFAYLADILVVPEYRGRGIAKALVRAMLDDPELQGLRVVLLRTRDAHGLYAQFGFRTLPRPEEMMALQPEAEAGS